MKTIFAWTAPGSNYPAYLNISRDGEDVVVSVRAAAWMENDGLNCGDTVTMRIPAKEWDAHWLPSPPSSGTKT